MSTNEFLWLAGATLVSFLTGLIYVVRTPTKGSLRSRVFQAPLISGILLLLLVWALGAFEYGLEEGVAAAFLYGVSTALFGVPGAIAGGLVGESIARRGNSV